MNLNWKKNGDNNDADRDADHVLSFCRHRYVWLIRGLENGGERMYQFCCALGRFDQV
jgi:hypothetical protein